MTELWKTKRTFCAFVYAPNGKKEGLQLIPVIEVAAKDEFGSIKNITRDDMLDGLRIPPQLMGIVPVNAGGFGSIRDATEVWVQNELEPLKARLRQVNEWVGEEVVRFEARMGWPSLLVVGR
ncbi:hypothetical protein PHLH8_26350 [Pseudomonas sp. Pc102]|nr:hypothetical protein PHLH8_26350 [Pseudomonas sp. Pc102]